jgi:hypothetical protein
MKDKDSYVTGNGPVLALTFVMMMMMMIMMMMIMMMMNLHCPLHSFGHQWTFQA